MVKKGEKNEDVTQILILYLIDILFILKLQIASGAKN
jgi:hypothetical protein